MSPVSAVRSFDVFDTLLIRRYSQPDHLHWMVGRRLAARELIFVDERAWRNLRVTAEDRCRVEDPDHTLQDVYVKLVSAGCMAETSADEAMAIEFDEELQSIRANETMKEVLIDLERKSADSLILSDTYFSRSQLSSMLEKAKIEIASDRIFSSSDAKRSKRARSLYSYAARHVGKQETDFDHTGDNFRADVLNARRAGARATWYRGSQLDTLEAAMRDAAPDSCEASLIVGAARAARLARPSTAAEVTWNTGAAVAGPILTAFTLWVVLQARDRKIRRLFFLARDGQVLCALARRLCNWLDLPIDCRYLLASRQALYLPSLGRDVAGALARVFADLSGKSASSIMQELEIPAAMAQGVLAQAGLVPDIMLHTGSPEAERLRSALMSEPVAARLGASLQQRYEGLLSYFSSEGFFDFDEKAIVDLGWHGNLQDRISRATTTQAHRGLHGFYFGLHCCPSQISGDVSAFWSMKALNQNLLETFCLAKHMSIHHYEVDNVGKPTGHGFGIPDQAALSWGVASQQAGIEAFCLNLIDGLDSGLVEADQLLSALKTCGSASLKLFTFYPRRSEADVYGRVVHAQAQTHENGRELAPRLNSLLLLLSLCIAHRRGKTTLWTWGMIARSSRSAAGRLIRCLIFARMGRFRATTKTNLWLQTRIALDRADEMLRGARGGRPLGISPSHRHILPEEGPSAQHID